MNPEKVFSTLLLGNDFDYILFKVESGMNVWFISPEAFEKIPENIVPPNKEILQLITFFYLRDYKDLLLHLNEIHLWHKIPAIIILSCFDTYCNLHSDNYNSLLAALVSTTLLDSASVCTRNKDNTYLILTSSNPPDNCKNRLQFLHDMYFPHITEKVDDEHILLDDIVSYYLNKPQ